MFSFLLPIIYLAFISLGLPDALLGSGWPVMYKSMNVPISYEGIITMSIAACTVISSLLSDRLTKKLGAGRVTAISVGMTAVALLGYSFSSHFYMLILWSIPYGLGAGSVDAALNNYVAIHYESRHMSWLHCMWGVGISVGPYIMSYALSGGRDWQNGYRIVGIIQVVLTAAVFLSLPLWKGRDEGVNSETAMTEKKAEDKTSEKPLSLREIIMLPAAKQIMVAFFCYCALEQTALLWGASYMAEYCGLAEAKAASFSSFFCIGITIGRGVCGFMTMKFSDKQMNRMGMAIIAAGVISIMVYQFVPVTMWLVYIGLGLVGIGCSPIYPCVIHSTPEYFGADKSQAVIGVEMASAYVGIVLMPPLFGVVAKNISMSMFPFYLGAILVLMFFMYEIVVKIGESRKEN